MAITSVGNGDAALLAAELLQNLSNELGKELGATPSKSSTVNRTAASDLQPSGDLSSLASGLLPPVPSIPPAVTAPVKGSSVLRVQIEDSVTLQHAIEPISPTRPVSPVHITGSVTSVPSQASQPTDTAAPSLPGLNLPVSALLGAQRGLIPEQASGKLLLPPIITAPNSQPPLKEIPLLLKEDVANVLLAQVATSDLTKLTRILDPSPDPASDKVLETLLGRAVQEVARGNAERAVGYLADYATRDPRRAESLPLAPELAPVRDKIDAMVNRMTFVAKMTAEDGLSRAEQTASQNAGKVSNWDTHADVLVKLAHRLFEAGGYANYSRTSDLARLVIDAVTESKPAHALAASATASAAIAPQAAQMLAGASGPFWVSPDIPAVFPLSDRTRAASPRRYLSAPIDDVLQNLRDLKAITASALRQVWVRAPLLAMLLTWFAAGLAGGVAFAIGSNIWPDSPLVAAGNFAFNLWGIGFLALVGFGFYVRVRHPPRH